MTKITRESEMALFDILPDDVREVVANGETMICIQRMIEEWNDVSHPPPPLAIYAAKYITRMDRLIHAADMAEMREITRDAEQAAANKKAAIEQAKSAAIAIKHADDHMAKLIAEANDTGMIIS